MLLPCVGNDTILRQLKAGLAEYCQPTIDRHCSLSVSGSIHLTSAMKLIRAGPSVLAKTLARRGELMLAVNDLMHALQREFLK